MLSTRLFKNFAVSHHLRSIASSSAPRRANLAFPLRLRAGASRLNSSVVPPLSKSQPEPPSPSEQVSSSSIEPPSADSSAPTGNKIRLEQPDPRLSITFTCTVVDCNTRSTHEFSKRSYTSGIVLVECPGCKNRHLIADHLGWFKDGTEEGKFKTIEEMMKSRGETVRRGRLDNGGVVEYAPDA